MASRTAASTRRRPPPPAEPGGPPSPEPGTATPAERAGTGWTLLTSHGRVLLLVARDPDARLRDLAAQARITERSAATIVRDLEQAGYLTRHRVGRRNRYVVHEEQAFRHPAEAHHSVGELIAVLGRD